MEREIKFRAKALDGSWEYGDLHLHCAHPHIHTLNVYRMYIDPKTVGQFTGLHDKNGKEIYEGDILHVIAETDDIHDYITQVSTNGLYEVDLVGCEYDFTTLAWLSLSYDECCTIDVIGNIYDNPKLLRKEE